MLARLAIALQNGQLQGIEGIGGQGFGGEGGTVIVDENCSVSVAMVDFERVADTTCR